MDTPNCSQCCMSCRRKIMNQKLKYGLFVCKNDHFQCYDCDLRSRQHCGLCHGNTKRINKAIDSTTNKPTLNRSKSYYVVNKCLSEVTKRARSCPREENSLGRMLMPTVSSGDEYEDKAEANCRTFLTMQESPPMIPVNRTERKEIAAAVDETNSKPNIVVIDTKDGLDNAPPIDCINIDGQMFVNSRSKFFRRSRTELCFDSDVSHAAKPGSKPQSMLEKYFIKSELRNSRVLRKEQQIKGDRISNESSVSNVLNLNGTSKELSLKAENANKQNKMFTTHSFSKYQPELNLLWQNKQPKSAREQFSNDASIDAEYEPFQSPKRTAAAMRFPNETADFSERNKNSKQKNLNKQAVADDIEFRIKSIVDEVAYDINMHQHDKYADKFNMRADQIENFLMTHDRRQLDDDNIEIAIEKQRQYAAIAKNYDKISEQTHNKHGKQKARQSGAKKPTFWANVEYLELDAKREFLDSEWSSASVNAAIPAVHLKPLSRAGYKKHLANMKQKQRKKQGIKKLFQIRDADSEVAAACDKKFHQTGEASLTSQEQQFLCRVLKTKPSIRECIKKPTLFRKIQKPTSKLRMNISQLHCRSNCNQQQSKPTAKPHLNKKPAAAEGTCVFSYPSRPRDKVRIANLISFNDNCNKKSTKAETTLTSEWKDEHRFEFSEDGWAIETLTKRGVLLKRIPDGNTNFEDATTVNETTAQQHPNSDDLAGIPTDKTLDLPVFSNTDVESTETTSDVSSQGKEYLQPEHTIQMRACPRPHSIKFIINEDKLAKPKFIAETTKMEALHLLKESLAHCPEKYVSDAKKIFLATNTRKMIKMLSIPVARLSIHRFKPIFCMNNLCNNQILLSADLFSHFACNHSDVFMDIIVCEQQKKFTTNPNHFSNGESRCVAIFAVLNKLVDPNHKVQKNVLPVLVLCERLSNKQFLSMTEDPLTLLKHDFESGYVFLISTVGYVDKMVNMQIRLETINSNGLKLVHTCHLLDIFGNRSVHSLLRHKNTMFLTDKEIALLLHGENNEITFLISCS